VQVGLDRGVRGGLGWRNGGAWACSKRLNPLPAHTLFQDGAPVGPRGRQGEGRDGSSRGRIGRGSDTG
jgi:hypothetical protein